jgi:hypothetical protein
VRICSFFCGSAGKYLIFVKFLSSPAFFFFMHPFFRFHAWIVKYNFCVYDAWVNLKNIFLWRIDDISHHFFWSISIMDDGWIVNGGVALLHAGHKTGLMCTTVFSLMSQSLVLYSFWVHGRNNFCVACIWLRKSEVTERLYSCFWVSTDSRPH